MNVTTYGLDLEYVLAGMTVVSLNGGASIPQHDSGTQAQPSY